MFDRDDHALAQKGAASRPVPRPPSPPSSSQPAHAPFTIWAEGSEAIPFDSLAAAEQDAVMAQAERSEANSGYDVAQKWSALSHDMATMAATETARRLAGLTGTDDIGVEP
jgi:hypothetical protein